MAAFSGCGNGGDSTQSSRAVAVAAADGTSVPPSLAGVVPTTRAPVEVPPTTATGDTVALRVDGGWSMSGYGGPTDYVGPPLEEVLGRTTNAGIVLHAYADSWGPQGVGGPGGGAGWVPARWCAPAGTLRVSMRLGEAIGVGNTGLSAEPFGGLSVQPLVAGYAEGTPFTALVVQATSDVESVAATFADGTVDSVDMQDGVAVLAAPTGPPPEDMVWDEDGPTGPAYTLTVYRGADGVEIDSTDVPFPAQDDYERDCQPPTELPAPGEQPADPAAAEQGVRDAFAAVFDFADRVEGDRSWLQHLDSDEGVEAAIDTVLGGSFGAAAQGADYTLGDIVFTSPTEAWFQYDLFANNNDFDDRFGLAVQVDGTWKISRGVICQDLALAGGQCDPAIGQLYPPRD